jgi:hypothetical protein
MRPDSRHKTRRYTARLQTSEAGGPGAGTVLRAEGDGRLQVRAVRSNSAIPGRAEGEEAGLSAAPVCVAVNISRSGNKPSCLDVSGIDSRGERSATHGRHGG